MCKLSKIVQIVQNCAKCAHLCKMGKKSKACQKNISNAKRYKRSNKFANILKARNQCSSALFSGIQDSTRQPKQTSRGLAGHLVRNPGICLYSPDKRSSKIYLYDQISQIQSSLHSALEKRAKFEAFGVRECVRWSARPVSAAAQTSFPPASSQPTQPRR